jgi:hypothetical protein
MEMKVILTLMFMNFIIRIFTNMAFGYLVNDTSSGTARKVLTEGKVFYDSILITAENSVQYGNYSCIANNNVGHPLVKVRILPCFF